MGCSYRVKGTVKVRNCSEVDAILGELKSLCPDFVLDVRDEETTRQITIEVGDYFSWAGTREIDETLLKLSPFCVAAARLETECDGERSHLYLGDEEQVRQAQSLYVLNRIKREAEHLAPKELAEAIQCLQGRVA
jgi:hypothetical protein